MTVIPVIAGVRVKVLKDSLKRLEELEIRGKINTIQTTALLILVRILTRFLET